MKLKNQYVVRKIGADFYAVAVSASDAEQKMIRLNETAAFLLSKCDGGIDEAALTDALLAEYNVEREQAAGDVAAFIDILRKSGLIDEG